MENHQIEWGKANFDLPRPDGAVVSWAANEAGKIVSVSHNVQQITGFTAEEICRMGALSWLKHVHPKDTAAVRDAYRLLFRDGRLFDIEYRLRGKNGGYVEVRDRAVALFVKDGVRRAEGVISDIGDQIRAKTERKALFEIIQGTNTTTNLDDLFQLIHRALKEVIFAENCFVTLYNRQTELFEFPYFTDLYDAAPPPLRAEKTATNYVFRTGIPSIFTRNSYRELMACGEAELIGTRSLCWMGVPLSTPAEIIGVLVVQSYDDERAYTERDLEFFASIGNQVALAIERKRAEQALLQARDELEMKVAERTAELANINEVLRVEIAERQRTEMAMQASERRFSLAFHASPVPMGIIRVKDSRYLDINESFLRVSGFTREEVVGRTAQELNLWAEPSDLARFRQTFKERGSVPESEFGFRIKSGRLRRFLVSAERFQIEGEPYLLAVANDITERKQAEEALRESERQYRLLFEDNPHSMWVYDLDTLAFLAVNDAAIRHYGYSRDEFLSMTIKDIRPPEDLPALLEDVCCARSGQNEPGIWRHRKKDGTFINVEVTAHTLTLPDERARLVLALDVSERMKAEAAFRETQERIAGIISSAMDAIITVDTDQRVILFNTAAEQMFGYSAKEVLGQPLDRFIPERFRSAHREHIPAFARTQVSKRRMGELGAIFGIRANGEEFPIEASISQVETGSQRLYTVILRDISARKRAEEELRRSWETYRRLFETAPDLIYTLSADGVITSINPACESLTGWKQSLLLGRHFTFLIHREDVKVGEAIFQQVLRGEIPTPYELRISTKSGKVLVVEFVSTPQIEHGKVTGLLGIARDITGRKQAEKEVQLLNEHLEQRVAQRTAQLEAANQELESFSYSVSHDLRAPLRAVAGFSRILREDYEAQLPIEAQQYLHRVQDNAQQMGHLIDDLLAFSRLGRQTVKKQPVATGDLVRGILEELLDEQEQQRMTFIIGDLPVCQADPSLLKQIFVNLLANAVKFTRQRETPMIEIGCCRDDHNGDGPVYFVKDNGVGFDMKYVHKLFGVFQRLHRAEEYEGTGVGLATVQRIIHRHGGRVWAEARLQEGASFYFTLGEGRE